MIKKKFIDNNSPQQFINPKLGFLSANLFFILFIIFSQYKWVFSGEMWAEMATNFFVNANSSSLINNFFSLDAGYIPFFLRIIAYVGKILHLNAQIIPYYYTWSALILTGIMVSIFCLSPFRSVVKSDFFRFCIVIYILIISDFESRTFINFPYYSAFFILILCAYNYINKAKNFLWYTWLIPFFITSKPAVLATLPALIFIALKSPLKFRLVAFLSMFITSFQLIQMYLSRQAGTFKSPDSFSLISKIVATIEYFFGFLGRYLYGKSILYNSYFYIISGIIFFIICLKICLHPKIKNIQSQTLISIGLVTLFFNVLLNCFALTKSWNTDLFLINHFFLNRHILVGFFSCTLIIAGLIQYHSKYIEKIFSQIKYLNFFRNHSQPIVFILWFLAGWLSVAIDLNQIPDTALINNSQWQSMSEKIQSNQSPLCVPINPLGWLYSRNCEFLNIAHNDSGLLKVYTADESINIAIIPPKLLSHKNLVSLAIFLQPRFTQNEDLIGNAIIFLKNGEKITLYGKTNLKKLNPEGLFLLSGNTNIPIKNILNIDISFSSPIKFRLREENNMNVNAIYWLGN